MALYNVAAETVGHLDEVKTTAGSLKSNRTPHGELVKKVAAAMFEKMSAASTAGENERRTRLLELEANACGSTSGGEDLARMVDVNRVAKKTL